MWVLSRRPNLAGNTQIIFVPAEFLIFIGSKGDIQPMTSLDLMLLMYVLTSFHTEEIDWSAHSI